MLATDPFFFLVGVATPASSGEAKRGECRATIGSEAGSRKCWHNICGSMRRREERRDTQEQMTRAGLPGQGAKLQEYFVYFKILQRGTDEAAPSDAAEASRWSSHWSRLSKLTLTSFSRIRCLQRILSFFLLIWQRRHLPAGHLIFVVLLKNRNFSSRRLHTASICVILFLSIRYPSVSHMEVQF